tara:strand:- start:6283 stop:6615 length:333 start_codon:yes stop_codon:yes gene_type:complete
MKIKKITVSINTTYKFLQVWNGIFNLTNKELEILAAFVDTGKITEAKNLCSMDNKKLVAAAVGIKDPNTLNNYIKRFKDKGVFKKEGNNYTINNILDTDTDAIEIKFNRY